MSDQRRGSVGFVKELDLTDARLASFRAGSMSHLSVKTQSVLDGELVEDIVERVVVHTYQNAQLLRYRLLQSSGVELSPLEEQSLVDGEEKNVERRSIFAEELGIIKDAVMMHFYPQKRAQLMAAAGSGGAATTSGGSSARGGRNDVGTNAQMLRLSRSSLSDIIREQIDTMFQATYQETSLRLAAHQTEVEEKLGPSRRLNRAIALQRERTIATAEENETLKSTCAAHAKRITELEASAERREAYHKQQLNGYLREVAVLKEQLYRTYRDKSYVGKDVDLMPPIVDDDACEDVSVDQLLHYRRTMRSVDQQIASYQAKVRGLEEEVEAREQAMVAFQERQRSRELAVANAQKELDEMNNMVVRLEQEKDDHEICIKTLKAEIHYLKTNVPKTMPAAIQATDEEDRAKAERYTHIETSVALAVEKCEAMRMYDKLISEKLALKDELIAQEAKAREEKRVLQEAFQAMEQRALYAEKRQADLRKISQDAIDRQDTAEAHAAEVTATASTQAALLTTELKVAQDEVVTLRAQNATLCLAYTNMWERLQAIKTKAGLNDYKRRSNEHHFQRAEAAIKDANRRIEATEARCAEELGHAEERVEMADMNVAFAMEDVKCLKRKHQADLKRFEKRIESVEQASLALLDDYNRLRTEHLKLTAADAMVDQEEQLLQHAAQRLGSASSVKGAASRQRRQSTPAEELQQQRQSFAFEILAQTSDGDDDAVFPVHVQALLDTLATRRALAQQEETFDRKVRPAQLPALAAKEFENALICAVYPLLETLMVCARFDAELLSRTDTSKPTHREGQVSMKDYRALVRGEIDAELSAMGLGEQREVAAWMKLKRITQVEGHVRSCMERMQRAAARVKIAPLDMAPLPKMPGTFDGVVVSAVDQAKKEDELQRVKEMQALLKEREKNNKKALGGPGAARAAGGTLQKKPKSSTPSTPPTMAGTAGAPGISVTSPDAAGPHGSVGPADNLQSSRTSGVENACNTTEVHEVLTEGEGVAQPDSSSVASTPHHAPLQRPPRHDTAIASRTANPLFAISDEDVLSEKPMSSHAPGNRRPSSTGSPRGRHGHGSRWSGLPSKHVILPSLRTDKNALVSKVPSESQRAGPSASSDASILADEVLAGVSHIPLRSSEAVESETPFGNALSVTKEYHDLRSRLEQSLIDKGLYAPPARTADASPLDTTVAAPAAPRAKTPATFTTTPPWKVFKEQQRRQKMHHT